MKTKKPFLNMDERSKLIAYKVIAVMYFLTIIGIQGVVIYRQRTYCVVLCHIFNSGQTKTG